MVVNSKVPLRVPNKDWSLSKAKQDLWQAVTQGKKSAKTTQNVNGNIHSGTRLSLLIETLTGTLVELTPSTKTMELRFLKRGCLQSNNIAADRYHNRPFREQFSPSHNATMLWIETHRKRARFVGHQSPTTMVVQIVLLSKSTLQPDDDLQSRLKCCNQYLSDNRQTNNKWNPL